MKYLKLIPALVLFMTAILAHSQPTDNYQIFWHCSGATDSSVFGNDAIGIPDQNGDGYGELLVSSLYPNGVFLYYGGNPMDTIPDMVFTGPPVPSNFGYGLEYIPNLVSHEYGTIAIATYFYSEDDSIYLYNCGPEFDTITDLIIAGEDGISSALGSHTCYGDVNGDGYNDYIATDCNYEVYDYPNGKLYVYYGGPDMDNQPDFTVASQYNNFGALFGQDVDCGDVNGDGYDDIAVSAEVEIYPYPGIVYLFYGGADMDTIPDWSYSTEGMWPGAAAFNNLNGDNFADIVLPTPSHFLIFYGSSSGLSNSPDQYITSVSGGPVNGGDINNDGYDDMVGLSSGGVCVYLGGGISGLNYSYYVPANSPWYVKVPGDINGDGADDIAYYSLNPVGGHYRGSITVLVDTSYNNVLNLSPTDISSFELYQNYPNPFNSYTTISFNIITTQLISLNIYDILGRNVGELADQELSAGYHEVVWDAGNQSSGIYFVQITDVRGQTIDRQTRRVVLLK